MTFVVSLKKPSCRFQLRVISNAGEDVQNLALGSTRVTHAVRGEKWQAQRFGKTDCHLVAALLATIAVPLHFDIDTLFPEEGRQLFNILSGFVVTIIGQ